jgi:hypothetical protein
LISWRCVRNPWERPLGVFEVEIGQYARESAEEHAGHASRRRNLDGMSRCAVPQSMSFIPDDSFDAFHLATGVRKL